MSPGRVLVSMLLCMAGGLIGECVDALFGLTIDPKPGQPAPEDAGTAYFVLGTVIGGLYGLALGITEGLYSGSRSKFWRAAAYGLVGGAICGYVGFTLGGALYKMLGGNPSATNTTAEFLQQMVARTLAWGAMGPLVGTVGGLPGLSWQRMRNGFIGGLIGGLLGGFVFQSLASLPLFTGFQLRLIGFGLLGASIGFFVGLVGEVLKQAWVKVLVGRNEGREHVIDGPVTVIGRDELVDVPVFLDPALAARQASIRFQNGRYFLMDEAGRGNTRLKGQVVAAPQPLTDGDLIQLGNVSLAFFEKATAVAGARRAGAPPPPGAPTAAPGGSVCEFCGVARDPATGACACSVGGAAPGFAAPGAPTAGAPTIYAEPPYGGGAPAGMGENPFGQYMNDPTVMQAPGWQNPDPYAATQYGAPAGDPQGQWGYGGPQLVCVAGPHAGQSFAIPPEGLTMGRGQDRGLPLADSTASRAHASIYAEQGAYLLRDDGSSNGTYVNGHRVAEHWLQPGDEIRIGATTLRFEA